MTNIKSGGIGKINTNTATSTTASSSSSNNNNNNNPINVDNMGVGGIPPSHEHFMLKDLDTGMQSYVTDQEWVEKPIVPSAHSSNRRQQSNNSNNNSNSKPPPHPHIPQHVEAINQQGLFFPQPQQPHLHHTPPVHSIDKNFVHNQPQYVPKRMRAEQQQQQDLEVEQQPFLRPVDHVRVLTHKKRDRDFANIYRWQRVHAHHGAIRVLKFNSSGEWLATGGADTYVKIWHIDCNLEDSNQSTTTITTKHPSSSSSSSSTTTTTSPSSILPEHQQQQQQKRTNPNCTHMYIRRGSPALTCRGHTSDVTDLSWSKNNFLLSGSLDGTLRLWHPRAKTCLRRLLHTDMVTSVAFHPTDEQICVSGTASGIVHMWHLKERRILSNADTDDLITSISITPDGTTGLVGTQHGRCKFYALFDEIQGEWQFKHTTQLDVRSKRAKNATGKKICGFSFYQQHTDLVLISSNDSRSRLYRMDDKSVVCKFVGCPNTQARNLACFDPTGRFVLCASEERKIIIWDLQNGILWNGNGSAKGKGNGNANANANGHSNDDDYVDAKNGDGSDDVNANVNINVNINGGVNGIGLDTAVDDDDDDDDDDDGGGGGGGGEMTFLERQQQQQQQQQLKKDIGISHESFVVQDSGQITGAVFAPKVIPADTMMVRNAFSNQKTSGLVIVTAGDDGHLRIFAAC